MPEFVKFLHCTGFCGLIHPGYRILLNVCFLYDETDNHSKYLPFQLVAHKENQSVTLGMCKWMEAAVA